MSVRTISSSVSMASVVGFLVVLEFASGVLQAWLPPLLPGILQQYGTTAAELNWVTAVYLLSTVVCVPLMSKLGDLYGHRRLLVVATVLVAIGSVVVAIAPSFGVLLLGRALQGPLGAFLPLEFAIIRERAGERSGRAIALLIGAVAVGGSLGFLLAGVARQYLSLSATLWIPAVAMIVVVPLTVLLVPETTVRAPGRIDWAGAGLLSIGLVLLLGAVGNGSTWGWVDTRTAIGIVGGLVALAAWVVVEQRVTHPLFDVRLVRRGGQGLALVAGFLFGAELYGSQAPTALFLGLPTTTGFGLGLSPAQLGLVLLVFGVAAVIGTLLAPRVAERYGNAVPLMVGSILTAAGYVLTALVHGSASALVAWQILVGIGNGLVLSALATHVVAHAPADAVGISSGVFNTTRMVGGAVSGAAFAAVMGALLIQLPGAAKAITSEVGYVTVWLTCAALAFGVTATAVRLRHTIGVATAELP